MLYIQLIGILAFCFWVLSYYRKSIKEIIIFQGTSNFIYAVHFFLLGALSGAYLSLVGIAKNIVFLKFKNKKLISIIFIILYLIVTIIFFEGLYSILPMCANCVYILFMIKEDKKKLLIGELLSCIIWLIYGIFVLSYAGIITEIIACISAIVQLKNNDFKSFFSI